MILSYFINYFFKTTKIFKENDNELLFKNGIYDLHNGTFREDHKQQIMMLDYNYDPHVNDVRVSNFLSDILPDENIRRFFLKSISNLLSGENKEDSLIIIVARNATIRTLFIQMFHKTFGKYSNGQRVHIIDEDDDIRLVVKKKTIITCSSFDKFYTIIPKERKRIVIPFTTNCSSQAFPLFDTNEISIKQSFMNILLQYYHSEDSTMPNLISILSQ